MVSLQEVCEKAQQIPCSPSILPDVVDLLSNQDAGLSDLESIIIRDPGLSSAVLKIANSAAYGGSSFDSISDAIIRLGFKRIYQITVSVTGGRWSSLDLSGYGWEPGDFCRHSFAVAVASKMISEETGLSDSSLAYTAGLMHDAGKLAIAYVCGNTLADVRKHQEENQIEWSESEKAILGFSHAEVTEVLLRGWNFPETLVEVGRNYLHPKRSSAENKNLVTLVHAGKHLAIQTGIGLGEDSFWTHLDQESIESLGLTEQGLQELLPNLVSSLKVLLKEEILTGEIRFD